MELSYALALGLDLSFLPGMGVYAEGFGVWSDAEHAYAIDGGLAYGLSPTLQFDAYLRTFLHDEVDDIGLGFGASFLF